MSNAKPGQYLTFQLGRELYGVPIEAIREINRVGEITPVPKSPPFVKGVMNLRGKIIPVIQLRLKFGMPEADYTRDTCIIVIDAQHGQVGMIVDAVKEVADLTQDQIAPPPQMGPQDKKGFVTGMGKIDNKVIILVDVVHATSEDQFHEIVEVPGSAHLKVA